MMKPLISVIIVAMMLAAPLNAAAGQLYQYRDKSGNLHFTDDIGNVPEDQRPDVDTMEAVPMRPKPADADAKTREPAGSPGPAGDAQISNAPETGSGGNEPVSESASLGGAPEDAGSGSVSVESLDREKEALDQMFREIQAQKQALAGKSPDDMNNSELNAYEQRVEELNARVADYKAKTQQFKEKVRQYNASIQTDANSEKQAAAEGN